MLVQDGEDGGGARVGARAEFRFCIEFVGGSPQGLLQLDVGVRERGVKGNTRY